MALEEIRKKVVNAWEMPEGVLPVWYIENGPDVYKEHKIEIPENRGILDLWLMENYPELEHERFFIYID